MLGDIEGPAGTTLSSRPSILARAYFHFKSAFWASLADRQPFEPCIQTLLIHIWFDKAAFIDQFQNRSVLHRIAHCVGVDDGAKLSHRIAVFLSDGRAGKSDIGGIRKHPPHLRAEAAILAAVPLVNQHEHITRLIAQLVARRCFELVDDGGDDAGFALGNQRN